MSLAVDAHCPLCGSRILAVSRGGRVMEEDLHPIALKGGNAGSGYILCDDCGVLTALPAHLSLN